MVKDPLFPFSGVLQVFSDGLFKLARAEVGYRQGWKVEFSLNGSRGLLHFLRRLAGLFRMFHGNSRKRKKQEFKSMTAIFEGFWD